MFRYTQSTPGGRRTSDKKKAEPLAAVVRGRACSGMDFVLCVYLVLMTGVMPFYFEEGYAHIATDKMNFCRQVNACLAAALALGGAVFFVCTLALRRASVKKQEGLPGWKRKRPETTDFFFLLYGGALVLSYLFSRYREEALWGAGNGWFTGFLPQLVLVAVYFAVSRLWKPRKGIFYLLLPVSGAVFLLGYLNRFGIYPIKMNMSSPSFISTIGNINWYCGYGVTVFFAGAAMFWRGVEKGWQKILLTGYVLLGFGTLVTQGSASGIFTLAVMLLLLFCLSSGDGLKMERFWLLSLLLSAACLFTRVLRDLAPGRITFEDGTVRLLTTGWLPLIMTALSLAFLLLVHWLNGNALYPGNLMKLAAGGVVILVSGALLTYIGLLIVNTLHPGSIGWLSGKEAFTFSDTWGSNRGVTWKAGIRCFWEQDFLHKLTGVGPDAMGAYIYRDGSAGLVAMLNAVFGEYMRLTNAHNEWLTVLVNTGLLGLAGFAGGMVTAIRAFLKRREMGRETDRVACACGFALLAYTVNNIFSFQQTVNLTTMMIILGMGMAFVRAERASEEKEGK